MDPTSRLAPYTDAVARALETSLGDISPPALRDAALHYPRAGGKRLRPAMALLACEAAGGRREQALPFAVAVELVHVFSLVHDDIMDRDEMRRGRPTVHAKWGEPTAILAGDALLAKAFESVAQGPGSPEGRVRAILDLATSTRVLCEGQALDMAFESRADVTVEEYRAMVRGKTGRLFELACRGGAYFAGGATAGGGSGGREAPGAARESRPAGREPTRAPDASGPRGGSPERYVRPLEVYGAAFGEAFQVHDDLLDLTPAARTGKPFGSDLRAGKKTLVLLEGARLARGADADALRRVLGRRDASDVDVRDAARALEACGAVAAARRAVDEASARAEKALAALPATPASGLLLDLARWAATRTG
ncbi:MAG TPA: polyprenyl synthetase family protein [Candidatus Thermoplasmatota archaeon]|nr:polyprenyl synthetase family protein [Candidatus Thermoplasmatota archaeon]